MLEQTDVESFEVLEPTSDGFRNYVRIGNTRPAGELLVDRARALSSEFPGSGDLPNDAAE